MVLRGREGSSQLREMGQEDDETQLGGRVSHRPGCFILRGANYLANKTQEPVSRLHRANPVSSPVSTQK